MLLQLSASVFDLRGPDFLKLYFSILVVATLLGVLWRRKMSGPRDELAESPKLDAFDIAYLGGGSRRAVNAAIASLLQRGAIKMSGRRTVEFSNPVAGPLHPIENLILESMDTSSNNRLTRLHSAALWDKPRTKLESLGLIVTTYDRMAAAVIPALLLAAVLAMGIAKICVGISRHRPVVFLVLGCLVTLAIVIRLAIPPWRTFRGDQMYRRLQGDHAALNASASRNTRTLSNTDVALAFGLWGPAMLTGTELTDFRGALRRGEDSYISSHSSCGSSCGGGGGSSCGSSCGGGGGCGGCGGGGCGS